jgi:hypothetical protein
MTHVRHPLDRTARRLPSRWPGRAVGALLGLAAGVGGLFWLSFLQREERHQWGREEIDAKKAVAGLIGKIELADQGAGIDAEKAKASGKTLVYRSDALVVKDQLDRGIPRDNLRLKIQAEADLTLAHQQRQLIQLDGFMQWLIDLQPKKEQVGPADAKLWSNPATLPAPRFTLVPVEIAADIPARAREAAESSPQVADLKKQLQDLQTQEKTAIQREQSLGMLLKDKSFQKGLPNLAPALLGVYEGTQGADAVAAVAKNEWQARQVAIAAAGKATATLRKLGKPEDSIDTALENHLKNRAELLRATEGAYRAGDRKILATLKNDPAFPQVIDFARAVDGDTRLLNRVRASELPQKKRVELVELLFACEQGARWLTRWVNQGSPLPGDNLPGQKPVGATP